MTYYPLTEAAQRHLDAGGCTGDFCGRCNGCGRVHHPHEREFGRFVSERCGSCAGTGMRG